MGVIVTVILCIIVLCFVGCAAVIAKHDKDTIRYGPPPGLGRVRMLHNKARRFGSATWYASVHVIGIDGDDHVLMMTDHEYTTMLYRERTNPEDIVPRI